MKTELTAISKATMQSSKNPATEEIIEYIVNAMLDCKNLWMPYGLISSLILLIIIME